MRQKCSKNVRLSTHSTPMIEVLSGERVGRFPRCPSKPAGPSRRDKASRARPPFESLSQASLGQAQLHRLSAVENMKSIPSYERAKYIMLAGRVIDMLDRSLHRILIIANNILMTSGTQVVPLQMSFIHALILSLIQSSVDERPTLCYPLSMDTKYILLMNDEQLG